MSSKSEQLNLRISTELKLRLQQTAETNGISASDFIRKSLTDAISSKNSKNDDRIQELENKLDIKWGQFERKLIMAAATISSMDTGLPLDHCIKTLINETSGINLKKGDTSRGEMEKEFLHIHTLMYQKLGVSETAKLSISLIASTYFAMLYSEDILGPTPFSLKTMERLRRALES